MANEYVCAVCSESFTSRNQLFKHLQEQGHSAQGHQVDPTEASARTAARQQALDEGWRAFEAYYSANPVAPDQLWREALSVFKTALPVVVRMQQSPAVSGRTGAVMKTLVGKQAVDGVPRAWEMPTNEEVRSAVASLQSVGGLHR